MHPTTLVKIILMASVLKVAGTALAQVESDPGGDVRNHTKLEFSRWSGELNIPDPVAISFDPQGRAYVTQTQRRKAQDLDIRNNRDWIPFDVGFETVQQKQMFYRTQLAPGQDQSRNRRRVRDLNKDGSHDYRDLQVISELIHVIEDTDGNGTADSSQIFAEGFQTEVTGIAAGVLWHDGHVYTTIAPDVWKLTDSDGDNRADQRQMIATGFGLHIAYAGHDMHGLTVGPDGRIYWSIGDKGISVVTADGREYRFPNQGGVMRCEPDGTGFEVFAHGLRNIQELAFDQYGNLFGVDNDADQPGERERFVYIAHGMDAGWRCNYQYRGGDYNPWTAEGLWKTRFSDQAAYIIPPIQYSLNGPAGFAFNPGTALGREYRDYFFLTGAPNGDQRAFRVEADGASFRVVDEHEIGRGVPLVGINFGPDGALYGVDWGGGYPLNQKGAVWKIDVPQVKANPQRAGVQGILSQGFAELDDAVLVAHLQHEDQRVRLGAQFELANRKKTAVLSEVALSKSNDEIARTHAIWGLGILGRRQESNVHNVLEQLLGDHHPEIRRQVARVVSDLAEFDSSKLISLFDDDSLAVRFQAALAFARHPIESGLDDVVRFIVENNGQDLYLRHAGIQALSALEGLEHLASHESEEVRLCAVVALRNQRNANVATFLRDSSDRIVAEAARAIHDDQSIEDALGDLARWLEYGSSSNEVIVRRSINANLRIGDSPAVNRVAHYAVQTNAPIDLRLDALDAIQAWTNPPVLDRVDGRNRGTASSAERRLSKASVATKLSALLVDNETRIRTAALATMRKLGMRIEERSLLDLVALESASSKLRGEAIRVLEAQSSPMLESALNIAAASDKPQLRMTALEMVVKQDREFALSLIQQMVTNNKSIREQQFAIESLPALKSPEADQLLGSLVKRLRDKRLAPDLALETLVAARKRAEYASDIAELLTQLNKDREQRSKDNPIVKFEESLYGGDPKRGEKLFLTHLEAQCVRCHKVGKTGSSVGPALNDVAVRRKRDYLLRSIVAPSADIDAKYRTRVIVLESGKTVQGVLVNDTGQVTTLADQRGKTIEIRNSEIDDSVDQNISIMPDMTKILSSAEIRDLVAYLTTLNARPE